MIVLNGVGLLSQDFSGTWVLASLMMPALVLWITRAKTDFLLLPWLTAAITIGLLFFHFADFSYSPISLDPLTELERGLLITLIACHGLMYFAVGAWNLTVSPYKGTWSALAALAPVSLLATGYLLSATAGEGYFWAGLSVVVGATYLILMYQIQGRNLVHLQPHPMVSVSLILAAHFAYSLAVAIVFEGASLTLALAAQVLSITWLQKTYPVKLNWVVKGLLGVVVLRLTFNPWLLTYPEDVHWSLWTYGGSFIFCFIAARWTNEDQPIRPWLEAVALHLFVLTLGAELRYWLYDGKVFAESYNFVEASINTNLWAGLGFVYLYRSRLAQHLKAFYHWAGHILLALSLVNYFWILLLLQNPLWTDHQIPGWPILNLILLAYGAPIVYFYLAYRWLDPEWQRWNAIAMGVATMIFTFMEIRHLWQGQLDINNTTSNGELYTYSLVWLAMAVTSFVVSLKWNNTSLYRGSMVLLLFVIAKIFLVDMAGLEGLLRVISFMGLGLCLLGLAFVHQYLNKQQGNSETAE